MSMALMGLGTLVALVGGIWILVLAFKEHIGWGLACLFIPGAALVFGIMKWKIAKTALMIAIAGGVVSGVGSYMAASAAAEALGNVNMAEIEAALNEAQAEAEKMAAEAEAGAEAAGEAAEEAPAE